MFVKARTHRNKQYSWIFYIACGFGGLTSALKFGIDAGSF
jgi:hypothetical protein